jgi:hypothetical protein
VTIRRHVIFDSTEPVVVRRYANESLAALDQAVLDAADIPTMLLGNRYSEIAHVVELAVRRQDVAAALELLDVSAIE